MLQSICLIMGVCSAPGRWQNEAKLETETAAVESVEPCVCYFSFLSLCISLLLCGKFILMQYNQYNQYNNTRKKAIQLHFIKSLSNHQYYA